MILDTKVSIIKIFYAVKKLIMIAYSYKVFTYTVGPWLSESPLPEPSDIRTLFQILKSFDFQQNQAMNGMPVWLLDFIGLLYHSTVGRRAYYSMYNIIGHPRSSLIVICKNSIVHS